MKSRSLPWVTGTVLTAATICLSGCAGLGIVTFGNQEATIANPRINIEKGGLSAHHSNDAGLVRAFELMETYSDHPMDLADASVVAAAEVVGTRKVFTVDRGDFETYRIRRGHRHHAVEIV